MKKFLALLLVVTTIIGLCACNSPNTKTEPNFVTDSEHLTINGMYVDESSEKDGEKVLYIFMTYKAGDANGSVSSSLFNIKVNETNDYSNEYSQSLKLPFTDYFYGKYIEEVKVGTTLNFYTAIKVSVNDLIGNKKIEITEDIDGVNTLKLSTDMIVFSANKEEICKGIDETVYNQMKSEEVAAMTPVSDDDAEYVYNYLADGYFEYHNSILGKSDYYRLAFEYPNRFTVTCFIPGSHFSNSGSYTVTEKYIILQYDTDPEGKSTLKAEYDNSNGDIGVYSPFEGYLNY